MCKDYEITLKLGVHLWRDIYTIQLDKIGGSGCRKPRTPPAPVVLTLKIYLFMLCHSLLNISPGIKCTVDELEDGD